MDHRIETMPGPSWQTLLLKQSLANKKSPVHEKNAGPEKTKFQRVAQEFESLLLTELLKSIRSAETMISDDEEKSAGSELHREMMDEQLARSLARSGGMGLAKMLEQQLQQRYGKGTP